jgi:heme O synthase-like polyprenyltransferase
MSVVGESVHIPGPLAKLRVAARAEPSLASVGDYLALMKPRVMSLVVFTALVGLVLVEQGIGLPSHALFR